MEPNKARLRAWVRALRSGEFKQTKEKLRDDTGHCCLGVACEIFRRKTGCGAWVDGEKFSVGMDTAEGCLPPGVVAWYGLEHRDPILDKEWNVATALNDAGVSFRKIATLIEKRFGLKAPEPRRKAKRAKRRAA